MKHFAIFIVLIFNVSSVPTKFLTCQPGEFFVDKYIKYECYQNDNVKGVRVVGCVPTNDMVGEVLESWQTFDEKWFKYHCVIDGDIATYSVKACRDPEGGLLPVGKSRVFPGGETFTCFVENNKVKLNHQTSEGCSIGENVYGDGASWTEKQTDTIIVGSSTKIVGQGATFFCRKYSNGTFKAEFAACLTAENTYIRPESYGTVDDQIVKCTTENGECKLREAKITEIRCAVNGNYYNHDQEWVSIDGKISYVCQYGKIIPKGCIVEGNFIPLQKVRYIESIPFYCNHDTRIVSFGKNKGCQFSNGQYVNFEKTIKLNGVVKKCALIVDHSGAAIFQWSIIGCAFEKEEITVNAIQKVGNNFVHCKPRNGSVVSKVMNEIEVEAWLGKSGKSWSNVMSGNEGVGRGVKREIKTAPPPITTTPKPTQTIPKPTTTPIPTTPFTLPITSKSPTTTTSPTPLIITTTTSAPPITVVSTPPKKCVDLIEDCPNLEIYCLSESEHLEQLKKAVKTSTINPSSQKSALAYLNLITTLTNVKDDSKSDSQCEKFCHQSGKKESVCLCKKQMELYQKIARSFCQKTCNTCELKSMPLSKILNEDVAKYCHQPKCGSLFL